MAPAVRPALTGLRLVLKGALALVYPPTCPGCGGAVADAHALCPACWSSLRLIAPPHCQRLGTPFAVDHGTGPCSRPVPSPIPRSSGARGRWRSTRAGPVTSCIA